MDGGQGFAASFLPERRERPVRRQPRSWRVAGRPWLGLLVPTLLLLAWQGCDRLGALPEQLLPGPSAVWDVLRDGVADGSMVQATLTSLRRVAEGFAIGGSAGLVLGGLMGRQAWVRRMLEPSLLAIGHVPVLGWVPILILLFGIDETPKIIVIGWSAFLPVMLNTSQGMRDVPKAFLELGRVLSFGRWSTFRSILLPAALPPLFIGLREGLANAWQSLVAVELIASFDGLGYMMAYGRQLFQLEMVLAAALIIGLVGLLLNAGLHGVQRVLEGAWVSAGR